ncbi:PLP-dependent cysteine synthase family protein [Ancylobacter mangrovi]|uniref:PLP-dependent cysteine synthase family protein n=1 Tax=Ancylobacter mangrovi TaxID=2972472 RepID=UPI0021615701|nr:PLP-dependent cysteine synthase family protein [Ancylobacter mangrovi]MCS0501232.1 PLP-dependent cysteine synthase family protein [Ancylobacter mangrovi]
MTDPSSSANETGRACRPQPRDWLLTAIRRIEADINRSADTHLIRVPLAAQPGITLYLKDESSHPTGSLKHRLARSLFLYALCNGWIGPDTLIVEASSGSTAVSEAYFARLLGLDFVAVMPRTTSREKIAAIEFQGGRCHLVDDPRSVYGEAAALAREAGGLYLDQFTFAERATDWRGNNNIAESIFAQMREEPAPVPRWVVTGAGTGGTSATIGRYIRYRRHDTRLCVADPAGSVFHRYHADRSVTEIERYGSVIEGIGRPRVEPSFIPEVVDRMIAVPDVLSLAAMRVISEVLGRRCGGSTGTNVYAALTLAGEMAACGEEGSIVTILCDAGERYASSLFDDGWLAARGLDIAAPAEAIRAFLAGAGPMPA